MPTCDQSQCQDCGNEFPLSGVVTPTTGRYSGDALCQGCYSEAYTRCRGCRDEIEQGEHFVSPDRSDFHYCRDCYDQRYTTCDSCGCAHSLDESTSVGDEVHCDTCLSNNFTSCCNCGEYTHNDDVVRHRRQAYCQNCAPDQEFWNTKHFPLNNLTSNRISTRTVGVELETSRCPRSEELRAVSKFGAKHDGSISGKEFVSPPLAGDQGLEEIELFCTKANEFKFMVDTACGFHLHVGVQDCNVRELHAIAYAYLLTQSLWQSFVPSTRRAGNDYCHDIDWTEKDLETAAQSLDHFCNWAGDESRYQWFNVAAYGEHSTFEIRLHSATLDAAKVVNWARAHVAFTDWAKKQSVEDVREAFRGDFIDQFETVSKIWRQASSADLIDFYADRARMFGRPIQFASTRTGRRERAATIARIDRKRLTRLIAQNVRELNDRYYAVACELDQALPTDPFRLTGDGYRTEYQYCEDRIDNLTAANTTAALALFDSQSPAARERQFAEVEAAHEFRLNEIQEEANVVRTRVEEERRRRREEERRAREEREREQRVRDYAMHLPANWRDLMRSQECAVDFRPINSLEAYVVHRIFCVDELEQMDAVRTRLEQERNQWKTDLAATLPENWRELMADRDIDPSAECADIRVRSREEGFVPCPHCTGAWVNGYFREVEELEEANAYAIAQAEAAEAANAATAEAA